MNTIRFFILLLCIQLSVFAQTDDHRCPTTHDYKSIGLDQVFGSSFQDIVENNKKRAVLLNLTVDQGTHASFGVEAAGKPCSGFILSDDPTEIVTNLHCIINTSEIEVWYHGDRKAKVEKVLKIGKKDDLAILKVQDIGLERLSELRIADSNDTDKVVTWPSCVMVNNIFTYADHLIEQMELLKSFSISKKNLFNPGYVRPFSTPQGENEAYLSANMVAIEGLSGTMVVNGKGHLVGILNAHTGARSNVSMYPSAEAEQQSLVKGGRYYVINRPIITKAVALTDMSEVNVSLTELLKLQNNDYLRYLIAGAIPSPEETNDYMSTYELTLQHYNALRQKGYDTPELKLSIAGVYLDYVIAYRQATGGTVPKDELLKVISEYEAAYLQSPHSVRIRMGLMYSLNFAQQVGIIDKASTLKRICRLAKEEQNLDPSNHTLLVTMRNFSCDN